MDQGSISLKLLIVGFCLSISACAVQGSEQEVSIEYPAGQFLIAEQAAERHCAKYNRMAQHVQTLPKTSNSAVLFLQTRTSVFECVEP